MHFGRPLFHFLAASTLMLAACAEGGGDTPAPTASPTDTADDSASKDAGTPLPVSESGWLTVGTDGAVQTTFFDPDGSYRDLRNGEPFAQGTWEQRPDGKVCFEPESGRGACWDIGTPDANGEAIATDGDDKSITIKRITYIAPADGEDAGG